MSRRDLPLTGHFRVGASHILAVKILGPVLTKLQAKHPGLVVDVYSRASWDLVDMVLAGKLDFAVGFSPVPHPQLSFEEVYRGLNQIVVRKDHPIFEKRARDHHKLLAEYPGTVHLATEKIFMARQFPFLKAMHLDRKINFGFDNDFVALQNLKFSDNWALMLDLFVNDHRRDLRAIPFPGDDQTTYTVQFIYHKGRRTDSFSEQALAQVKAAFAGLGGKD